MSNAPIVVSKLAIIGAGISGIAAAKQLSHHNPIVFEATSSIGGVWKHCSYRSTLLQTPRQDFEFSDYPWPRRDLSDFPSHTQVLEYLHGYATYFDLYKYVQFNSQVVKIRFGGQDTKVGSLGKKNMGYPSLLTGQPVWEVAVKTNESESLQWYAFEFLVVCIGKYGDMPNVPVFPPLKGPQIFNGKVLHSLDYCKLDSESAHRMLKGKKVVVIGYKKSAIDLAVECAEANQGSDGKPCTMVIRTLHWTVPSYRIWGLPFFIFFSTRFSQFLQERPNQSLWRTLTSPFLSPMRKTISKFIESYLLWKLPLVKYGLKPNHPFVEDYASCQMAILPKNFFQEANEGRILFKKTRKWWFWEGGVELDDGTKLEADVVVLATGFDGKKKLKSLLPACFSSLIEDSSGIIPLYRGTIHPLIPNMAFVGYVESVSNLHSAELRCRWLARLIDGHFKLPTIHKMLEQTTQEKEVMKRTTRFYKRHCISTFSINHSDEICREMGWETWRKKSWLSEAFTAYSNHDYRKNK